MANDLNRCEFIGRLGADPESRFTPAGDEIVNLKIAVGKSWKDKNSGDKKESTTWVPIVFFGSLAGICSQYLKKGSKIYVAGEYRTRSYEKDGQTVYITEVVGQQMQMLDGKPAGSQPAQEDYRGHSGSNQPNPTSQRSNPAPQPEPDFGDMDGDIPFSNPYKNIEFIV